jgi:hypothetical protein
VGENAEGWGREEITAIACNKELQAQAITAPKIPKIMLNAADKTNRWGFAGLRSPTVDKNFYNQTMVFRNPLHHQTYFCVGKKF